MNNKILFLLLSLILTPVLAQESKEKIAEKYKVNRAIYCFDLKNVWEAAETIDQKIVWVGKDNADTEYALLVSEKSRHFTIVHFNDKTGCILGGGIDFRYGKAFEQPKK